MPTRIRSDSKPSVEFDPLHEISPFVLFRRLRDGRGPRLIDVRPEPGGKTLRAAESMPEPDWKPQENEEVLFFDDDGSLAYPLVERLHELGLNRCKALFGGLDLYEFALDPEVVGEETYLVAIDS